MPHLRHVASQIVPELGRAGPEGGHESGPPGFFRFGFRGVRFLELSAQFFGVAFQVLHLRGEIANERAAAALRLAGQPHARTAEAVESRRHASAETGRLVPQSRKHFLPRTPQSPYVAAQLRYLLNQHDLLLCLL
jgi:hypothetical protein